MKRFIALTFSLCAAAVLSTPARAQGGFDGPGWYEITNVKSGKVLDLDRNDQTTVIQYSPRGTDNQIWEVRPASRGGWFLINGMNGRALDAPSNRNSAPVEGEPFDGRPSQEWRIEAGKNGEALIVSSYGKALDIPGGTTRDGARVQVYDPDNDSNQRFTFRRVGNRGPARRDDFRRPERFGQFDGDGACLYERPDFGGEAYCIRAGEDVANVPPRWERGFRSIKLFGRAGQVELFDRDDFRGARYQLRHDQRDLGRDRDFFDSRVNSIRVR